MIDGEMKVKLGNERKERRGARGEESHPEQQEFLGNTLWWPEDCMRCRRERNDPPSHPVRVTEIFRVSRLLLLTFTNMPKITGNAYNPCLCPCS